MPLGKHVLACFPAFGPACRRPLYLPMALLQAYYVEATEYFPGGAAQTTVCSDTINMPDDTDDAVASVSCVGGAVMCTTLQQGLACRRTQEAVECWDIARLLSAVAKLASNLHRS